MLKFSMLKCFVVNMPSDRKRWARLAAILRNHPELDAEQFPAIVGKSLPRAARSALSAHPDWADRHGEIGCFLSHAALWEQIALGHSPALIIEDDALLRRPERLLEFSDNFGVYDFVFVNARMCHSGAAEDKLEILPVGSILPSLAASGHGVGTDGYLLTPLGAQKLCSAVNKDLFYGNVDGRLLRYALTEDDISNAGIEGSFLATVLRQHHNALIPPRWGVLKAGVLNSFVAQAQGFQSTIRPPPGA